MVEFCVGNMRNLFKSKFLKNDFVIDKTGVKMLEIVGMSFVADEETIFGEVNHEYVKREIDWYNSQSLNVYDIEPPVPKIWEQVADKDGNINSNYGYLVFSEENGNQYKRVLEELKAHPFSRRAIMIYTRPNIWNEYNFNGMSDFICTNAVSYLIRNNKLHAHVQMRSSDGWAGYRNDRAWQKYILYKLSRDLNIPMGDIYWTASSLHLYERQFYLVDHAIKTGENSISKKEYDKLYK